MTSTRPRSPWCSPTEWALDRASRRADDLAAGDAAHAPPAVAGLVGARRGLGLGGCSNRAGGIARADGRRLRRRRADRGAERRAAALAGRAAPAVHARRRLPARP